MQSIINAAVPHVLEMLGLALTGIIAWGAAKARAKGGIDIEARHREALHSALMTGAHLALSGNLSRDAAVQLVLSHVRASVQDALRALRNAGAS